jgi:hypothetical protein
MPRFLSFQGWLDHLRVLYPITGVLHVGAGGGASTHRYRQWAVPRVAFVEADQSRSKQLSGIIRGHGGWTVHNELLADKAGKLSFYYASNLNESGILAPESLASFWPNLRTVEQRDINARTIKDFFESNECGLAASGFNWAHIDCLPALPILQGAEEILDAWSVVIARVIFDEKAMPEQGEAWKGALDEFMGEHGYLFIDQEEERHPALGQVLYVHNWKDQLELQLRLIEQGHEKSAEESRIQISQLIRERDAERQLAKQLQGQVVQVNKDLEEQKQLAQEHQTSARQIIKERDEQKELVGRRQAQIDQLSKDLKEQKQLAEQHQTSARQIIKERDEQKELVGRRQARIDQLNKDLEEQRQLAQEHQTQTSRIIKERDEQKELAVQRQAQIDQLRKGQDDRVVELERQIDQSMEELREARQTANLAVRLQTLRDEELKVLRAKYKAIVEVNKEQQELLQQLRSKLQVAAKYFHQLEDNGEIRGGERRKADEKCLPARESRLIQKE